MRIMEIRPLQKSDYTQWLPLWSANCLGQIDQDVTNNTWRRICDRRDSGVNGFGLFIDDELCGIVHYILHPVTGSLQPACYMQDVFIASIHRRKGFARALIEYLAMEGRTQNWARIYWLAEKDNIAAQNLYKTLGITLDFTLHILPTQDL